MIRPATPTDAAWIAALWNGVIETSQITFTTTLKTVAEITDLIATRPVLVLPDDMGFATYGPFRGGPGYAATAELSIYLAPRAQGQGHGSALLNALLDHAKTTGIHVMVAGASGTNPAAVRFHHRHGFETVAHMPEVGRKDGVWLDLILMQKRL